MHFNSPDRPRLANGFPCWLSAPGRIVLPTLDLRPEPDGWGVHLLIGGSWGHREGLGTNELFALLADWVEEPEEALRRWWGREPPGEERREGRTILPSSGPKATSIDELDL